MNRKEMRNVSGKVKVDLDLSSSREEIINAKEKAGRERMGSEDFQVVFKGFFSDGRAALSFTSHFSSSQEMRAEKLISRRGLSKRTKRDALFLRGFRSNAGVSVVAPRTE